MPSGRSLLNVAFKVINTHNKLLQNQYKSHHYHMMNSSTSCNIWGLNSLALNSTIRLTTQIDYSGQPDSLFRRTDNREMVHGV